MGGTVFAKTVSNVRKAEKAFSPRRESSRFLIERGEKVLSRWLSARGEMGRGEKKRVVRGDLAKSGGLFPGLRFVFI